MSYRTPEEQWAACARQDTPSTHSGDRGATSAYHQHRLTWREYQSAQDDIPIYRSRPTWSVECTAALAGVLCGLAFGVLLAEAWRLVQ